MSKPFVSFAPCEGCKAAEALEEAGTLVKADFGAAANAATNSCSPKIVSNNEKMGQVLSPLVDKYDLGGYEDALRACVIQRQLNQCARLVTSNQLEVVSDLL